MLSAFFCLVNSALRIERRIANVTIGFEAEKYGSRNCSSDGAGNKYDKNLLEKQLDSPFGFLAHLFLLAVNPRLLKLV